MAVDVELRAHVNVQRFLGVEGAEGAITEAPAFPCRAVIVSHRVVLQTADDLVGIRRVHIEGIELQGGQVAVQVLPGVIRAVGACAGVGGAVEAAIVGYIQPAAGGVGDAVYIRVNDFVGLVGTASVVGQPVIGIAGSSADTGAVRGRIDPGAAAVQRTVYHAAPGQSQVAGGGAEWIGPWGIVVGRTADEHIVGVGRVDFDRIVIIALGSAVIRHAVARPVAQPVPTGAAIRALENQPGGTLKIESPVIVGVQQQVDRITGVDHVRIGLRETQFDACEFGIRVDEVVVVRNAG